MSEGKPCGGCLGIGAHRKYCPHHPNWHPWRQLADRAEDIGDRIGSNDTEIANTAYYLSSMIRNRMSDHPAPRRKS